MGCISSGDVAGRRYPGRWGSGAIESNRSKQRARSSGARRPLSKSERLVSTPSEPSSVIRCALCVLSSLFLGSGATRVSIFARGARNECPSSYSMPLKLNAHIPYTFGLKGQVLLSWATNRTQIQWGLPQLPSMANGGGPHRRVHNTDSDALGDRNTGDRKQKHQEAQVKAALP